MHATSVVMKLSVNVLNLRMRPQRRRSWSGSSRGHIGLRHELHDNTRDNHPISKLLGCLTNVFQVGENDVREIYLKTLANAPHDKKLTLTTSSTISGHIPAFGHFSSSLSNSFVRWARLPRISTLASRESGSNSRFENERLISRGGEYGRREKSDSKRLFAFGPSKSLTFVWRDPAARVSFETLFLAIARDKVDMMVKENKAKRLCVMEKKMNQL
ncbi:uncharacterized protein G2W53_001550 [Senna tora]|uniref:Uncharacterized protein n=1 Tax=Senna tora TaxID=362788 RepID=A0A834XFR6_9FABA|nr:uncharacterized protein G2W53_001550 [Senna tora]